MTNIPFRRLALALLLFTAVIPVAPANAYPALSNTAFQNRFKKSRGRWQVIVIWGSWCKTCETDFRDIEQMLKARWKTEPLDFWTISLDGQETEAQAESLMKKADADWETYRAASALDSELITRFLDGRWKGEVPHYVVFNPKGERALIRDGHISGKKLDFLLTRITGRKAKAIKAEEERKLKEAREKEKAEP